MSGLKRSQRLFLIEGDPATTCSRSIWTGRFERFNPDMAGAPQLVKGKSQLLYEGMGRLIRELGAHRSRTSRTPSPLF